MTPLQKILTAYRRDSRTEREKATYFEELIRTYFRHEPRFADLYEDVWLYGDWAREIGTPEFGHSVKDTGIDLVARTCGTGEYHAIQCKCYAEDHRMQKKDIDSFFTASGQKPFVQRIIVATTNDWSENAEAALVGQTPPVYKLDLHDLETSQLDWAKYQPSTPPALKPRKTLRPHQTSAKGKVVRGFETEDRGKLIMACGTGKNIADKTTVIYNDFITLRNIPLEAYDYIVNGKPALEWVMERQSVTTDKASGITNDANLWATETMNNPKYPLELFLRVVTVSLETNRILAGLPKLEID